VVSALRFNNKYVTVVPASSADFDRQAEYPQTVILDSSDAQCFGEGTIVHPEGITTILAERLGPPRRRVASVVAHMGEIVAAIGIVIGAKCEETSLYPPQDETLDFPDA
jgi:hypothetical protein